MYWRNSARSKVNNAHVLVPVINEPSRKNQAGTFPFGSSDVTQRIDNAEV
jgi:hypothetical protein